MVPLSYNYGTVYYTITNILNSITEPNRSLASEAKNRHSHQPPIRKLRFKNYSPHLLYSIKVRGQVERKIKVSSRKRKYYSPMSKDNNMPKHAAET